ncbi:MAG: aminotransferase class V-fold PLP-dependent enzyme, partial [Blautia sp.]|nr:aminotransferase class V-fold PLP-dependent enzyme [Blautia sp.]
IDSDLYGGSVRLFDQVSRKNGLSFTKVDFSRDDWEKLVTPQTKAVFLETPSNPMMRICDIRSIGETAKRHGLLLMVDNTFLSPYLQSPLKLGADVVIHSGTKYLGGHNDTLAGFLVVKDKALGESLRFLQKTTGATLSPFDAFLTVRGMKTLPLRMEKAQENAFALARWLRSRPEVTRVFYPGFEDHPGHEIQKRQARGFGSMLSFEVADRDLAIHLLENVSLIAYAESLGGVETLLTYPLTQTHADVPQEERLANGITDRLLRLSVGIEDVKDLIEDLEAAFDHEKREGEKDAREKSKL